LYEDDADVLINGKKMRVTISPEIDRSQLSSGREVVLNESLNIISIHGFEIAGEIVKLKNLLDNNSRAVVIGRADEERVVRIAESLSDVSIKTGDSLLLDSKSGFVYEKIPKSEVEELVLEEVPDVNYEDIGGLGAQIEQIRDAVELPFLHKDLYAEHQLKAPKGILLYGPPGCGKTLIAKAVANSLAKKVTEKTGNKDGKSYFLNIKGPELLNKYVGETERHIRLIFQRARDKASEGTPVIVFFDEMDSLFKTRGSGVSSDVENTIVPQLLSEIDGVEGLENVIVIGASNREDMIDPAILRPGRLDVKIKIQRPNAQGAAEILSKYLTSDLPINEDDLALHKGDRQATVKTMIDKAVEQMYTESDQNRFIEVTYVNGDKEILYFKDFSSGAMLENIVSRAKKAAIKEFLSNKKKGIRVEHLISACLEEFRENEDLPNSTNPDDWARISGKKGERIVFLRTLIQSNNGSEQGRSIETIGSANQFL
jgi:proteasome-associated ATPase